MQVTGQDYVEHKMTMYALSLMDNEGHKHMIHCFGMDSLTLDLEMV